MEFQLTELIDGQYKVVEKHRGGMSIVYIVLDEFSHKRFAIKTVKEELLEDRVAVERFCEEAKTWMNIGRHTHVVEAIIYRDINEQPFLWLEYVDGSDLKKLIESEKRLFAPQVVTYALEVCEAMAYVHTADVRGQQGVVHRDLKPANIMLERRMGIKITDFGLAKVYGKAREMTDVGVGLGTYLYMPPEQFLDAASADATSDVFSFGASMYTALTNQPPVSGDTVGAIINSILSKTPASPSEVDDQVPSELSDVVMRCLAKARGERYSSFEELAAALRTVRPAVDMALKGVEVRKCQGCGHTTTHGYRVCPICRSSFDVGLYGESMLGTQEKPATAAQVTPPTAPPVEAAPTPAEDQPTAAKPTERTARGRATQASAGPIAGRTLGGPRVYAGAGAARRDRAADGPRETRRPEQGLQLADVPRERHAERVHA